MTYQLYECNKSKNWINPRIFGFHRSVQWSKLAHPHLERCLSATLDVYMWFWFSHALEQQKRCEIQHDWAAPHWGKNTHFIQKFTDWKSHNSKSQFSQKSPFQNRNFHKNQIFKKQNFRKYRIFQKIHIISNINFKWIFWQKMRFCPSVRNLLIL